MRGNKEKRNKAYQGFFLSLELTEDRLALKFCRALPLSWVKLEDVDCMRSSFFEDIFPRKRRLHKLLRNRYWFSSARIAERRLAPFYVIETHRKRRRIFLRLESSFHYRVRSAIGRIKSRKNSVEQTET